MRMGTSDVRLRPGREREVALRRRPVHRGQLGAGQCAGRAEPHGHLPGARHQDGREDPRQRVRWCAVRRHRIADRLDGPVDHRRALRRSVSEAAAARSSRARQDLRHGLHERACTRLRTASGPTCSPTAGGGGRTPGSSPATAPPPGRHALRSPADRRDARGHAASHAGGRARSPPWSTPTPTGTTATATRSLAGSDIVASARCAEEMAQLPASAMAGVMRAAPSLGPAGAFLARIFAPFSFDEIPESVPDHHVRGPARPVGSPTAA